MRSNYLRPLGLALGLGVAACNGTETPESPGSGGSPLGSGGSPQATGGSAQGGWFGTGGTMVGGTATGGRATGGAPTGGTNTGGTATGGKASGGTATGGKASGGTSTGGSANTGGSGGSTGSCGLPAAGSSGVAKPSGTAGNLKVVNWAGFKGAVTFSLDDANTSQINNYTTLNGTGVHFTFYLVSGWSNSSNAIWKQAVTDGHEIGNHTKSHSSTASATDLADAHTWLESTFGIKVYTMAAPNGDTSWAGVAPDKYFINRGVSGGSVSPGTETTTISSNPYPFNLLTYIPASGATAATMTQQVTSAASGGKWQVFCVHGFTGDSSAYNPVALQDFVSTVNAAKTAGNWVDTMVAVGAYWRGQNAFQKVQPTSSGGSQTWTWTLPAHFPPNKCLRVTVDGGTLAQGGNTLAWDSHGYYEVSLDKGSLTLSP